MRMSRLSGLLGKKYVWDTYAYSIGSYTDTNDDPVIQAVGSDGQWYYGSGYSFNTTTGTYTLTNPVQINSSSQAAAIQQGVFSTGITDLLSVYHASSVFWSVIFYSTVNCYKRTAEPVYVRGASLGQTVTSSNRGSYPEDYVQDECWYKLRV